MQTHYPFETVSDDELLRRLVALIEGSRHTEADLVAHLGEVDVRRLYVRQGTPSMFVYCSERRHLSEAEAGLRIAAARASRVHLSSCRCWPMAGCTSARSRSSRRT